MATSMSLIAGLLLTFAEPSAEVSALLLKINAVGPEGKGNVAAAKAWQQLVAQGPGVLIDVLGAIDDDRPRAANWLRSAADAIAGQALDAGKPLPAEKLEVFVRDTKKDGRARRLAYELLVRIDPTTPKRLLPGMVNDPGAELRRDAVARLLDNAGKLFDAEKKDAATKAYQEALEYARDGDQILKITERLKKLGVDVDTTAHFGFITQWHLVGPFNNVKGVGFGQKYAPETKPVDLTATYVGKDKKMVGWKEYTTKEDMGVVDLNKVFGDLHGAVVFGHATVMSNQERPVEIRAGSNNAVRIYLNGKEIYFREEYHHGMRMDQHVGKGVLKAGKNEILVKVCQNEQKESWAQKWSFQLRICDDLGAAVPVTVVSARALPKRGTEE